MAENRVQCPNCMGYVMVPILEVGMVLNCPMCGTQSRITKEIHDQLKAGETPISERMHAVSDLPALPGMGVGEETADADTFADDASQDLPPDAAPAGGVPPMPGMAAPGAGVPPMPGMPGAGAGMQGRSAAGGPALVDPAASEYPGLAPAGMTPTQAMAAHRKGRAGTGDTGFRSRIIGEYSHEKLAKLAVDVGNTGRTRGYMAAVLLLIGAFLPINFLLQEGSELNPNPGMQQLFVWEFEKIPDAEQFTFSAVPDEVVAKRIPDPGTSTWVYIVGLPAFALLAFLVARFARYKRRGWYYVLAAGGVLVVWQFNPYSAAIPYHSPIRQYDPLLRPLDGLLVCVVAVQIGLMAALRYFHDIKGARVMTTINTLLLIGLAAALVFNVGDRTLGYGSVGSIEDMFTFMPVKAGILAGLLGCLVLFPLMLIVSPTLTTQALTNFVVLLLLFTIPLSIIIGSVGNYDVPTTVRHWFGLLGLVFLLGTGVAEILNNRLLKAKIAKTLDDPEDWWGPEFTRMRLDARYHAKMVGDEEYRREYKRLTDEINKQKYAHMG